MVLEKAKAKASRQDAKAQRTPRIEENKISAVVMDEAIALRSAAEFQRGINETGNLESGKSN